ncbi:MAG TPA: c-type cytochrome [Rhodanobacteraceae bacterium]|jgi:cytochrome c oxidase cbb3-type subunit 3|nr:c-type cytochrome [Rhodanobacteraceae bacterium]
MKNRRTVFLLAACMAPTVIVAAIAQTVSPHVDAGNAQLRNEAVSHLHIGPSANVRNPYADQPQALMQGKLLFQHLNCNGCHAPGGGGGMGPSLSDQVWLYGSSPGDIYLSIAHGRPNGMPQWGTALPPQAIWELVTYVQSLSEPQPEFEPTSKQGATPAPAPGQVPHPAASKQPAALPKHQRPAPKPPHPAPASAPAKKTPAAPASSAAHR